MRFFEMTSGAVLENLRTSEKGLTQEKARERLLKNGPNEIKEEKKKNVLEVFFSQFEDLLVIILLVCSAVSILTGNGDSAAVILLVIVMNSIIGTVEHFKAEKSLAALKNMSAPHAKVIRDGNVCEIPAREVVKGDILILEAGAVASADGRVIKAAGLLVNESSLTGESDSVLKSDKVLDSDGKEIVLGDRVNMVYSGSLVTGGRGVVVVTATGMETEIGNIATMINKAESKKTPLQKSLENFSKKLTIAIVIICLAVMALSILRGEEILDAMMFAVALAVAAIPEALSSIVTISLAIGTQKMAKQNAIIRDLKAVEGLGCVSVICSDKTGTLTQNKMKVREIYRDGVSHPAERFDSNDNLILPMLLCNDAAFSADGESIGDPTETALIEFFGKERCDKVRSAYPRLAEIPFDSDRKLMSTLHKINGKPTMLTKGAIDNFLDRLTSIEVNGRVRDITNEDKKEIVHMNVFYSERGMRVLCFAKREFSNKTDINENDENKYTFIGLCAMTDPPREESKAAVADCISAGIKPVMITGDHKMTAIAVAREVGIFKDGDLALDGAELEMISDSELSEMLPKVSVYARVSPAHKIRIVTLWQELGHIVAMTGDGVNDAPALKKADVGVAMGITGTEVSKDAASMVLADDNFATIVRSVASGRSIYTNIKNSIMFLLTGNLAGIIAVLYCVIMGLSAPFTAVQLLFINLLTDSLPAIAISMEKPDRNLLNEKPRGINDSILDKKMIINTSFIGILISISTIASYYIGLEHGAETAGTMAFSALCLGRLFHCFNCRGSKPINVLGFGSNPFSIVAFAAGVCFLSAVLFFTPIHDLFSISLLGPSMIVEIIFFAVLPTVIIQIYKNIRYFLGNR